MPSTVTLGIGVVLLLAYGAGDLGHARAAARAAHGQDHREDDDQGDEHDRAHQSSILSRWALVSAPGERSGERHPRIASTASTPMTTTIISMIDQSNPPVLAAGASIIPPPPAS